MLTGKVVTSGCGERCGRCSRHIPNGTYAMRESGNRWRHEDGDAACRPIGERETPATTRHAFTCPRCGDHRSTVLAGRCDDCDF